MQCTGNNAYQNYWVSCAWAFSFLKDWRCSEMFPLSVLQFAVMSSMKCQCIRNWYMECVLLAVADLLCSLVINYSGIWLYLHSVIGKEHKIYDVGTVSNRSFTYKESSFQFQPYEKNGMSVYLIPQSSHRHQQAAFSFLWRKTLMHQGQRITLRECAEIGK